MRGHGSAMYTSRCRGILGCVFPNPLNWKYLDPITTWANCYVARETAFRLGFLNGAGEVASEEDSDEVLVKGPAGD